MLIDLYNLIIKYDLHIRGIIHCGAHHAEEFGIYDKCNINNVIWIEANPNACDVCRQKLFGINNNIVIESAIDINDGIETKFNITNNGESSSLLELKNHLIYYPNINVIKSINVTTKRLDTIINENDINMKNFNFLNLDLQGIELRAIKSIGNYISNIDYIYTEINRDELYMECDTINELDEYLLNKNFIKVEEVWTHANWGDAFYIKNEKVR